YEISECLVGSEMCIRDRVWGVAIGYDADRLQQPPASRYAATRRSTARWWSCLLYTSDAADE
ncbi:hypothetical protein, partial [Pseudomonas aeruginosa]|uniref:hypothetical protein n=1 Tax=Pseudomonas aeruginosa TaxID=287 RepID=UPI0019697BD0